ncbi:hypothetical protein C8T65DRAFT_133720 [Cerioporus squamosus]|nr:hypothetical protein C8T65DRAFT_133720 [Cerioporus squamosus]
MCMSNPMYAGQCKCKEERGSGTTRKGTPAPGRARQGLLAMAELQGRHARGPTKRSRRDGRGREVHRSCRRRMFAG